MLPLAVLIEGPPPPVAARGLASLAYVGPFATAFAYWGLVEAGRHFPVSTMSMALLATPGLGILISAFTLREAVGASLLAGLGLTCTGIWLTTRPCGGNRAIRSPGGVFPAADVIDQA